MDQTFIALVTYLGLSALVAYWAHKKGMSPALWLGISILLSPLLALLGVAVVPAQNKEKGMKRCPLCAELVQKEARVCRFCGADLMARHPAG